MICPACGNTLSPWNAGSVVVDVCQGGCGGIWFDLFEMRKVDEQEEREGRTLLHIVANPAIRVDARRKRPCPRCDGVYMMRRFFSRKKHVEIDECGNCGGIWLDPGELEKIRRECRPASGRDRDAEESIVRVVYRYISEVRYGGVM
ncbi:MAG TPA: zf-TFIIB domain-containing protein [Candidatus Paceibacterota bacterium]|nr:zf-TFIIB domain-containing protein [Verrucomicrobiota bacterium]HOX04376.1 zf-TFIIB domain-containing protein [Verrucomicrobiota bacterium]HRZ47272.1 zf-TFIIB domain-containing protein [Candidatus Paceibacterota bacterium]HRZ92702.1 zf-TFIIB domain-containing protein [Candidatus Paceibacterota bacterium]